MITFNLLPDSKLAHLKGQKRQRTVGALSVLAIAIGIGLPLVLIALWGGQKALLGIIQDGIDKKTAEIQDKDALADHLTVQQQLKSLPALQEQRIYNTTFTNLLPKLMPSSAGLTSLEFGESGTVSMGGKADSLATINDFVSILGNTVLVEKSDGQEALPINLFSSIVLKSVTPSESGVTFEVQATFDITLLRKTLEGEVRVREKIIIPFKTPEEMASESEQTPDTDNIFQEQNQ